MSAITGVEPRNQPVSVPPATGGPRTGSTAGALANARTPQGARWVPVAAALGSALLLWMTFFPLAWGWLAWVALTPFLALVRIETTPRRRYWCAYLAGSAFFWPALQWMRVADPAMYGAWALLAVYCAGYFPATLWLIRLLERRTPLPLVLSVPIAWTAMEFVRSFALTGFAWYYLGHSQHTFLSVIQIADLGGVYLISFLIAAVNAWLFEFACYVAPGRWPAARSPVRGLIYQAGAIFIAIVGTLVYGGWRLSQNHFQHGPVVSLLQTSIDQRLRNAITQGVDRPEALGDMTRQIGALCKTAITYHPRTDLIIWPETSYPSLWLESSPKLKPQAIPDDFRRIEYETRQHLTHELLKACPTAHLLGMNSTILTEDGQRQNYNSAILLQRDGVFAARYDKMHRVPFGEFVPFRETLPFLQWLAPYDFDYSIRAGETFTRLPLGRYTFGVLICYEDTDPFLARRYALNEEDGPPVDFLVNISNDGWFDGTSEHEEHLAISRFRAIESRRALVRAVNMGVSAVIDSNGRVLAPQTLPQADGPSMWLVGDEPGELPVEAWDEYKKSVGVLRARVPIDSRSSFYARAGDWLPGACWALIVVVVGWSLWQRPARSRAAQA